MKLSPDARGVYAIAPTPFAPDGAIDRDSLHRMCDFYLKAGVTGIWHTSRWTPARPG